MDPAGLLADRGIEPIGKVGSGCDQRSGIIAQPQKRTTPPLLRKDQAKLIVLGQTFGGEWARLTLFIPALSQFSQGQPGKPAANSGRRKRSPQGRADQHRFGMGFGEFIGIVPGNPARAGLQFGPHWQLHEITQHQCSIDRLQRGRMDHIFGIVQDHTGKAAARSRLIGSQCAVQTVEAIGLGSWSCDPVDNHPDPRVPLCRCAGGCKRGGIVAVTADINRQVPLRPGCQHMGDGGAHHGRFLKGRDQHRGLP